MPQPGYLFQLFLHETSYIKIITECGIHYQYIGILRTQTPAGFDGQKLYRLNFQIGQRFNAKVSLLRIITNSRQQLPIVSLFS